VRHVHNLRRTLGACTPDRKTLHYGEEMWALFEKSEPGPAIALTGHFVLDECTGDVDMVMWSVASARREALIGQQ
jgi:RIO kinase 1